MAALLSLFITTYDVGSDVSKTVTAYDNDRAGQVREIEYYADAKDIGKKAVQLESDDSE